MRDYNRKICNSNKDFLVRARCRVKLDNGSAIHVKYKLITD